MRPSPALSTRRSRPRRRVLVLALLVGAGVCPAVSAQSPTSAPAPLAPVEAPLADRQISAYVREVFQDRDGNHWFGTNGEGVCRFDGMALTYFGPGQGFGGLAVRGIAQDNRGAMWFATDAGVTRYASGTFTNYTTEDGLTANSIWSMLLDRDGTLWVGTHGGVCRLEGETFVPFPLPRVEVERPESRFSPKVVFAMEQDRAGHLWFGTDGEGAHRYDGTSFTSYTTKDGLGSDLVRSIRADRRGRIWIGTDGGGVSCLDGTAVRTYTHEDGLCNDRIFEILQVRNDDIWFSTLGAGACRYDGTTFTAYGAAQGLSTDDHPCPCGSGARSRDCHGPFGPHVQEFCEDRAGVLWLGCSGGLFRLDGERFVNVTRDGPWPARPAPSDGAADANRTTSDPDGREAVGR